LQRTAARDFSGAERALSWGRLAVKAAIVRRFRVFAKRAEKRGRRRRRRIGAKKVR
jgi:hypothetical protein